MKAILINPTDRTITEIEVQNASDVNEAMGVELVTLGGQLVNDDTLYVDDEGLLVDRNPLFKFRGTAQPIFAGNAVLIGFNPESGESMDVQSPLERVKSRVEWTDLVVLA